MADPALARLIDFIQQLKEHRVFFTLGCVRDAVMVTIPMPDRYIEAEFFADGTVEVQTFGPPSSDVASWDTASLLAAVLEHLDQVDDGPSPLDGP